MGQDRADPFARRGPRHRLLHRGRSREPPLRRESRHDSAAPLERAAARPRPSGLARPRPRPQGRAVHRRRQGGEVAPSHPGRARAAELREDLRGHGPAHPAPARRALRLRGGANLRAAPGGDGRRGRAGDLDDRAPAALARRQGLHRLRPERPRPDHRRPVLGAPAARGAGLVPAPLGRGDRPARSRALHHQDGAGALRPARRSLAPVLAGHLDVAAVLRKLERRNAPDR